MTKIHTFDTRLTIESPDKTLHASTVACLTSKRSSGWVEMVEESKVVREDLRFELPPDCRGGERVP